MKKIADEPEPVVVVPIVGEPIEVALTLGVIEPQVADLLLVLEGLYKIPSKPPPFECSQG